MLCISTLSNLFVNIRSQAILFDVHGMSRGMKKNEHINKQKIRTKNTLKHVAFDSDSGSH